jgi:uncharacterized protein
MPLTRYRRTFEAAAHPGRVVLFSTRTCASLLVPAGMPAEIERGAISEEERATLAAQGFLVESAAAERREILGFIDELAAADRSCKPVVVLNLDCNLACVYCFEGTRKGKHYLSDETADALLRYLEQSALPGCNLLHPTFYGGEPLLSFERLLDLAARMKDLCDRGGIPFQFSLITNGTLLTRDRVERMRPLGLKSAAVTLDGPRETHDAARPYRDGRGSHDVILRNLREVADLVELQVGGNFTPGNWRSYPRLLDELAEAGLTPERIGEVRFDPVFREVEGIAPPEFHGGCTRADEPWVLEATVALREEVLRRGYRSERLMPSRCMMDYPGRPVINHDGDIYPCSGFLGRGEFKIGDLLSGRTAASPGGEQRPHARHAWRNETCLACAYLPLCFGGCPYMALIADGRRAGLECRKAYFDAVLEPLVLQDIRYKVGT